MRDLRRWIYAALATLLVGGIVGAAGFGNFAAGVVGVGVFTTVYSALQRMDGNRKIAVRSDAERAAALALVPPPGQGVLYVYRTSFMAKLLGIDVAVDGVTCGQLLGPRSMQLVLAAGRHEVTASSNAATTKAAEPLAVDIPSGGTAVVELQIASGMVKNIVKLRPEPDVAAARQRLAGMPMIVES